MLWFFWNLLFMEVFYKLFDRELVSCRNKISLYFEKCMKDNLIFILEEFCYDKR